MIMEESETDKTEQATPFKLDRSRKKGVVARGADLGLMAASGTALAYFWIGGAHFAGALAQGSRGAFRDGIALADSPLALLSTAERLVWFVVSPLLLLFALIFASVLIAEIVQTGGVFSTTPLTPDFSRLNPANGIKRVFSVRALVEAGKNLLKMAVYTLIAALVIQAVLKTRTSGLSDAQSVLGVLRASGLRLLAAFVLAAMAFAVLDQIIARRTFLGRMRMSRRELRREAREREGEPRIRQKRRQLHRQLALASQSLRNLRKADVLITNPDHVALALRYDARTMIAPTVVSIGTNHIAQRYKRLALIYGIPVVENRALARQLYRKAALNQVIPPDSYQGVAAVYNALRAR